MEIKKANVSFNPITLVKIVFIFIEMLYTILELTILILFSPEASSAIEKSNEKFAIPRSALQCDVTQPEVVVYGIREKLLEIYLS